MKLGRELTTHEMWKQSHCRKGSRPLDKDLSNSLVSEDDSEGSFEEENLNWVDDRAKETWVNYNGYVVEKYGEEHSELDKDSWSRAVGGVKRGKLYGLSNVSGTRVHVRQDPEIEKLNLVIKELVKEKEDEKERLNGIIAELVAEKEKDKAEKDAMLDRMTNIEAMLKSIVQ
ncbi:uncharacterized protein LOC143570905 [Bidens hawaiensis]|uniref:uncharacterized protein LOC143570905 n=1 Tax=Bidens hawaiensis TaxID=980011 RepID=UPI00404952DC